MKRLSILVVWAAALASGERGSTGSSPAASAPARLEPFTLTDQFEREHAVNLPRERPLLLTVADRRAASQVASWVTPLKARFAGHLDYLGVADVRNVPSWLRGRVRRGFQEAYAHPVLLDWDGQLCRAVGVERGRVAVWLVARDGTVSFRGAGPADAESRDHLTRAVETLLASSSGPEQKPSPRED